MALSRQSAARHAAKTLQRPQSSIQRRGLAAPASGTFKYETGKAAGINIASRDLAGPTSTVALVAKAGTRYEPLPGLAEGLKHYAWRNTNRRSALRLQRESELFGAQLFNFHSRESLIIGAKFFRDDLPYFLEAMQEIATETKYINYEFVENIMPAIHNDQVEQLRHVTELAVASAHSLAFHRGLGEPLYPTSSAPVRDYLSAEAVGAYSTYAYRKPNIAIVGNGVEHAELEKWTGEFFADMRTEPAPGIPQVDSNLGQSKYYGGEERIAHANSNAMVFAFPGSSSLTGGFYKPEIAVLAALLGGKSAIKWSTGSSLLGQVAGKYPGLSIETKSAIYSDAGLLYVTVTGNTAAVRDSAQEVVNAIKSIADGKVSSEDVKKARAQAKFRELEYGQEMLAGIELTGSGLNHGGKAYQLDESAQKIDQVTEQQVKKAAADLLVYKSCVSTVGDLYQLPYAEELGLQV